MKTFTACLVFACLLSLPAFAASSEKTEPSPSDIRQTANAQMFRYARELYRKGAYEESAAVFQRILAIDCRNKLAQYHLQKIAARGAEFKNISKFLKDLPCPAYNFSDEDFLPSSIYYEKDPDLVLEQLAQYNKRYRMAKTELAEQIKRSQTMITQLEDKAQNLSASLTAAKKDSSDAALWKKRLLESQTASEQLKQEASRLKAQLNIAKAAYARESRPSPESPASPKTPDHRKQTREKQWQDLKTLEKKFANVQERLAEIESSLKKENAQIKNIHKDISTTQK